MAIDLGERRHGVALSDPMRLFAHTYGVVERSSRQKDFSQFRVFLSIIFLYFVLIHFKITPNGVAMIRIG